MTTNPAEPRADIAAELIAAFQPLVEVAHQLAEDLQPALQNLADALQHVHLTGDATTPPAAGCHCLCGLHQADGMFCGGNADGAVPLTSPLGVVLAPMCEPCLLWWLNQQPASQTDES